MHGPQDRVTGARSTPVGGWTGRWSEGGRHLLDSDTSSESRDLAQSDDLDAIGMLGTTLAEALRAGSWLSLVEVPLLARHDDEALHLEARELTLRAHIASIARVCERFITRLHEESELLPVSRVRRPARRAIERLSAHTEDWAARTLSGPVPRRALAVTRVEDADLYENRMVTELVYPILATSLSDRIRRLRRLTSDLADLARARDEGTHHRRRRLYAFWGEDASRATQSINFAGETLLSLEAMLAWIQSLRGSSLALTLRGRRTGQRSLRYTNVIENDKHYHAAGLVWLAYEREPDAEESPAERQKRLLSRQQAFDDYVLGLVVRALDDLGYGPDEDVIPQSNRPVVLSGRWGQAELARQPDGVISLAGHGATTRFVPLIDVVGPGDNHLAIAGRWASLDAVVNESTVVVYLGASAAIRDLPPPLASAMISSGPDSMRPGDLLSGVAVSPLETTSLERVARSVSIALLTPALLDYPAEVQLHGGRVPRRLIDHLTRSDLTQPGLSPLLHRRSVDALALRRPLTQSEQLRLDSMLSSLSNRTKAPGWERDVAAEIEALGDAIDGAAASLAGLLICPVCEAKAPPIDVGRDGDLFMIVCRACGARWGHERCGACADRIPIIETERGVLNPDVTGPGWIERIYGRDALSSPCWARTAGRYVCPACRTCALSDEPDGAECVRCHAG